MIGNTLLISALLCFLPISELRGGLPFALSRGIPVIPAVLYCVLLNALVGPLLFLFLSSLHKVLSRLPIYQRLFTKLIDRARNKVKQKLEKYGYLGLVLFVAIPLPITGVYTGTLGAWVLGMKAKRALPAVALGAILAGIIVTGAYFLVTELGVSVFRFLFKEKFS